MNPRWANLKGTAFLAKSKEEFSKRMKSMLFFLKTASASLNRSWLGMIK